MFAHFVCVCRYIKVSSFHIQLTEKTGDEERKKETLPATFNMFDLCLFRLFRAEVLQRQCCINSPENFHFCTHTYTHSIWECIYICVQVKTLRYWCKLYCWSLCILHFLPWSLLSFLSFSLSLSPTHTHTHTSTTNSVAWSLSWLCYRFGCWLSLCFGIVHVQLMWFWMAGQNRWKSHFSHTHSYDLQIVSSTKTKLWFVFLVFRFCFSPLCICHGHDNHLLVQNHPPSMFLESKTFIEWNTSIKWFAMLLLVAINHCVKSTHTKVHHSMKWWRQIQ